MLKVLGAYAGAVLTAFVLGSILASQFILANVSNLGMDVSLGVRLQATLHDLAGLSSSYLPLVAIALLIALLAGNGIARVFPAQRSWLLVLAGAAALVTVHVVMKAVLGLSAVAATRTLAGLLAQGLAGAAGGFIYLQIRSRQAQSNATI